MHLMTEPGPQLISNRRAAAFAVLLMAVVWFMSIRSCLSGSWHHTHEVLPWHLGLLGRWAWVGDVIFYGWLLWVAVGISRTTNGKERLLFAGFLFPILLIPLRHFSSGMPLAALQYVGTASYTVALVAALLIFRDRKS
jgi:hypothetical protein